MPRQMIFTLDTRPSQPTQSTQPTQPKEQTAEDPNPKRHSIFMRGTAETMYNEILTLHLSWDNTQSPHKENNDSNLWHLPEPLRQHKEHKSEELVLKTSMPTKDDPYRYTAYERDSIATEQVARRLRAIRKRWNGPGKLLVVRYSGEFKITTYYDSKGRSLHEFMMQSKGWPVSNPNPRSILPEKDITSIDFHDHVIQALRLWRADVLLVVEHPVFPALIQKAEQVINPPERKLSSKWFSFGSNDDDDDVAVSSDDEDDYIRRSRPVCGAGRAQLVTSEANLGRARYE